MMTSAYEYGNFDRNDARTFDGEVVTITTYFDRVTLAEPATYSRVRVFYSSGDTMFLLADGDRGLPAEVSLEAVKTLEVH